MTNIAFIGLGHMGLPMAVNLTKAGHTVAAFDLSEQARDAATQAGVPLAESGAAAASTADVVITMLPKGAHVLAAYEDLLPAARPAPCSSIPPPSTWPMPAPRMRLRPPRDTASPTPPCPAGCPGPPRRL